MIDEDLVKRLRTSWDTQRSIMLQTDAWMSERHLAADRIEALTAERDEAWAYMSAAQGDLYDAIMIEAERDRLREERDAILSDSTIHSDQREKYERLCARIAAGKASQQDAVDAIRQLCRDNERLALRRSDARAALKGESHE